MQMNKILIIFMFLTVLISGCQKQETATAGNVTEENFNQEELVQKYQDGLDEAIEELNFIDSINSRDVKTFRKID